VTLGRTAINRVLFLKHSMNGINLWNYLKKGSSTLRDREPTKRPLVENLRAKNCACDRALPPVGDDFAAPSCHLSSLIGTPQRLIEEGLSVG
jgi:hypothetical protein